MFTDGELEKLDNYKYYIIYLWHADEQPGVTVSDTSDGNEANESDYHDCEIADVCHQTATESGYIILCCVSKPEQQQSSESDGANELTQCHVYIPVTQ